LSSCHERIGAGAAAVRDALLGRVFRSSTWVRFQGLFRVIMCGARYVAVAGRGGLSGTHSVGHSGPMVESAKNRKLSSRAGEVIGREATCSCDRRTGASRNATGIKARPKGRCVLLSTKRVRVKSTTTFNRHAGAGVVWCGAQSAGPRGHATPLLSIVTTAAPSSAGQAASVVNVGSSQQRLAAINAGRWWSGQRWSVPDGCVSSSRRHVCSRQRN